MHEQFLQMRTPSTYANPDKSVDGSNSNSTLSRCSGGFNSTPATVATPAHHRRDLSATAKPVAAAALPTLELLSYR
ncbi:Os01g0268766 [Oryza sativa Japonica Group]|uniref:Os01g0268766 protein n=1 Tax=Oryza sativa subsp. japonica TaxID=39947 RepID=A0A0P0V0R4_ORYSJ|nr:Os01g0268766 [Oryza sativa Japonica Group]